MRIPAVFLLLLSFLPALSAEESAEYVSFNFDNVQLKTVINKVAELTGKNFVFDEAVVTGNITMKSPTPIPVEEVYGVLEAILEIKDFALVPSKTHQLVRVIPRELAVTKSTEIGIGTDAGLLPGDERLLTQVIPLRHADSEDVLRTVQPFISGTGTAVASPRTNTLIITDSASNIARLMRVIGTMDEETPPTERRVYVYPLENADAEAVAEVLEGIHLQRVTPEQQFIERNGRRIPIRQPQPEREEEIQIKADRSTNSLVITAYPREYESLREVISRLDRRRDQVLIEALIAEVSMDKLLELGAELSTWDTPEEDRTLFFGGTHYGMRRDLELGELSGGLIGVMRGAEIGAILQFYKEDADFEILSSPYIFTRDNEEAQIFVGEDVPFVRESRITERDLNAPTVIQTYDYRDVGINLNITPHISPQGYVRLKIHQVVEKLREGPTPGTPITVKREIQNTVEVQDGNTVVIGGLVRDDRERIERKIPLLGDIPVLGFFFRTSKDVSYKTSLLIFITPHVITSPGEMLEITEQKREEGRILHDPEQPEEGEFRLETETMPREFDPSL